MIQGGDPNSKNKPEDTWGFGDPSQTRVPAEFSSLKHKRGILSAARSNDPNSANSQFFICVKDSFFLDGKYTIYGQVIKGMEVADKIVDAERNKMDRPLNKIEMKIEKISE
jgi:peptidyl-prolyl cis-trans isomerase B (cyclophilin B)